MSRAATPDFEDAGLDEVRLEPPPPPPKLATSFFGLRRGATKDGSSAGGFSPASSVGSTLHQAEEKVETMVKRGLHLLDHATLDKNYWMSLEDEASRSKYDNPSNDLIIDRKRQRSRKKCRVMSEDQVPFPLTDLWVGNPLTRYRWDLTILVLIIVVMVLAPFEIAFLRPAVGWFGSCNGSGCNKGFLHKDRVGLFIVNSVIDVAFIVDIFLALNTAYFDADSGKWVVSRPRIFFNYLTSWMLLDVLSVLPWELMQLNGNTSVLRLAKCMRLLKLLRVLKQPRIMARLNKHCTIRAEMMTVLKYCLIFCFQIHFGACILRAIDGEVLRQNCNVHAYRDLSMRHFEGAQPGFARVSCPVDLVKGECPLTCPQTVLGFYWNQGIWSQYVAATAWTLGCMQGELNGNCVAELVLNVAMSIVGMIIMAFLVGDLCNAVSNMDPVKNDFTLAFDSLNNYIDEVKPPPSLRYKLREFMSLSEVVFREDYHRGLLERLSPGLLSVVAQHNLAGIVVQLPFYVDTLHRAYNLLPSSHIIVKNRGTATLRKILRPQLALQVQFDDEVQPTLIRMSDVDGTRFVVKYPRDADDVQHDEEHTYEKRWCTLIRVHPKFLLCDVFFDELLEKEDSYKKYQTVPMTWIDTHSYGTRHSKARMARALYEENRFVVALTQRLTTRLYMPKDTVIRNNCSLVDEMYVVHAGKALVFGRHTVDMLSLKIRGVDDVMGDDICTLLVGDRLHRRRHFTAKAQSVLHVFVLNGDTFCEIVESGSFDEFRLGVKRYGCFLRIQRALIIQTRARLFDTTIMNSHVMTYEEQATEALSPQSQRPASHDEERALESDAVLSALRDVQADLAKLAAAPAAVRRAFAEDNGDLAALAPMFGDLKRRVVGAFGASKLGRGWPQRLAVVSSLGKEEMSRTAGFRNAL